MTEKIRIKDIAEKAGVSVGTVDRVLHRRPNVSKEALEKVEKVLKETDYQPNVYASALASNKSYIFLLLIPEHKSETYWEEIEEGTESGMIAHRDFHVDVKTLYYKRFDKEAFEACCSECVASKPDGVIIVPAAPDLTRNFAQELHKRNIPFVLLDSYIPDLHPLSFFGQDSLKSGSFAARMLMLLAAGDKQIMLMKQTKDGKMTSRQQENREVGFKLYMQEYFPDVEMLEVNLPVGASKQEYDVILEEFFSKHPNIHHCMTFNSKAHLVGDFLLRTNRRNVQIMGYDMVGKNVRCMEQGSISFIIAQHAFQQGYGCVDALFNAVVLKKEISPLNYMPIELLTRENMQFYRRKQI